MMIIKGAQPAARRAPRAELVLLGGVVVVVVAVFVVSVPLWRRMWLCLCIVFASPTRLGAQAESSIDRRGQRRRRPREHTQP